MTVIQISGVRPVGVATAVPSSVRTLTDDALTFGESEVEKISENTGVYRRHIAPRSLCTSDLCFAAANRLIEELGWKRDSIDILIFVSQTPDYVLPPTSCVLQERLGFPTSCIAYDVNLGCSGYIYGLWMASGLIAGGAARRALLLVGDTITHLTSPLDRSTALLFGDAGTATALEQDPTAPKMWFDLGTDGKGKEHLMVAAGASRYPRTELTSQRVEREKGNLRSDEDLYMDGAEVFSFTLHVVPRLVKSTLTSAQWTTDDIDFCVMHQANRFIIQHLTKRIKMPAEKVVTSIEDYGNTSSASIPLTLTCSLTESLRNNSHRLLLVGFGVGWSWGAAAIECGPMVMPELILVPDPPLQAQS